MITKPITFKRGNTFAYIFSLELPEGFSPKFFEHWVPTAQLRKERSRGCAPPIADISCYWVNEDYTALFVYHKLTGDWPLGRNDLDILLTAPGGYETRTQTIPFIFRTEVTHD